MKFLCCLQLKKFLDKKKYFKVLVGKKKIKFKKLEKSLKVGIYNVVMIEVKLGKKVKLRKGIEVFFVLEGF